MTEPTTLPPIDLDLVRNRTREDLEQLQLQRLRQTLEGVYANVPAYRAKFDGAGVRPQDLESLGDLASFPFTTNITHVLSKCNGCCTNGTEEKHS